MRYHEGSRFTLVAVLTIKVGLQPGDVQRQVGNLFFRDRLAEPQFQQRLDPSGGLVGTRVLLAEHRGHIWDAWAEPAPIPDPH